MGKSPCRDANGLKRGPWTAEEDRKLLDYIQRHGHGSWRALPEKAGLQRCGKSCRLRWINYLRPDIKRGKFALHEEQTIIQLHALLGNRWSAIAAHLPKRTDNEIKNYWNTHIKKRLAKMGIDPMTHRPKVIATTTPAASNNLSHMAQWESARLEAEARLVKEAKAKQPNAQAQHPSSSPAKKPSSLNARMAAAPNSTRPRCHDILKAWESTLSFNAGIISFGQGNNNDLESPTSILQFPPDDHHNKPQAHDDHASSVTHTIGSSDILFGAGEATWNVVGSHDAGDHQLESIIEGFCRESEMGIGDDCWNELINVVECRLTPFYSPVF